MSSSFPSRKRQREGPGGAKEEEAAETPVSPAAPPPPAPRPPQRQQRTRTAQRIGPILRRDRPVVFEVRDAREEEEGRGSPQVRLRRLPEWQPDPSLTLPRRLRKYINNPSFPVWRPRAARSPLRTEDRAYVRDDYTARRPVWPYHQFPQEPDLEEEGGGRVFAGIEVDELAGTDLQEGSLPYGVLMDQDRSHPQTDERLRRLRDARGRLWEATVVRTLVTSPMQRTALVWLGRWREARPAQAALKSRERRGARGARGPRDPGQQGESTAPGREPWPGARVDVWGGTGRFSHTMTDGVQEGLTKDMIMQALRRDMDLADAE